MSADVDFCVTCYERTYRDVLRPGFFPAGTAAQAHRFARRTALINNVTDRADAQRLAQALRSAGELDAWFFVDELLPRAFALTGMSVERLGRAPYFVDWGLALVSAPGPDWLLHVDAEVRMAEPVDWVTAAIELMDRDARVMVANPSWYAPTPQHDTLPRTTLEDAGEFAIGLGFSDQVFLVRRRELAAPIYDQRCIAMLRYPMFRVSPSFEARIDAWMRHHDRLRATHRHAQYIHPDEIGGSYPRRRLAEKARFGLDRALLALVRAAPIKRRCWRAL